MKMRFVPTTNWLPSKPRCHINLTAKASTCKPFLPPKCSRSKRSCRRNTGQNDGVATPLLLAGVVALHLSHCWISGFGFWQSALDFALDFLDCLTGGSALAFVAVFGPSVQLTLCWCSCFSGLRPVVWSFGMLGGPPTCFHALFGQSTALLHGLGFCPGPAPGGLDGFGCCRCAASVKPGSQALIGLFQWPI